jgi:hypothetical protein
VGPPTWAEGHLGQTVTEDAGSKLGQSGDVFLEFES